MNLQARGRDFLKVTQPQSAQPGEYDRAQDLAQISIVSANLVLTCPHRECPPISYQYFGGKSQATFGQTSKMNYLICMPIKILVSKNSVINKQQP